MKLCKIYNQVLVMRFSIGILVREYIILIRIFMTRDICRPMVSINWLHHFHKIGCGTA